MYFPRESHTNTTTGGVNVGAEEQEVLTHSPRSSTHTQGEGVEARMRTILILAGENEARAAAVWDTSLLACARCGAFCAPQYHFDFFQSPHFTNAAPRAHEKVQSGSQTAVG